MRKHFKFDEVLRFLEEYKEEYGDCVVRQDYKTASGVSLGNIVMNIRSGVRKTTEEEKAKLDAIGFVWDASRGVPFEEVLRLLEEYKEEYGDCAVRWDYKTASGVSLGNIVMNIRSGARKTTEEEKAKLDAIGFVWDASRVVLFEEVLRLLEEYKAENGHCEVKGRHKTASGVPLGNIVMNIRSGTRKTTEEEKAKLDAIGFVWRVRNQKK